MPSPAAKLGFDAEGGRPLRFLVEAGYALLERGDLLGAGEVFDGLKAVLPDDPAPWLGAAEVGLRGGWHRQAERDAQAALRRANASLDTAASALVILGDAATQAGHAARAAAYFQKAVSLAPDAPAAEVARQRLGLPADGRPWHNDRPR